MEVRGVTVLDDEMFIVRRFSSEVEVYDSNNFTLKRNIEVNTLRRPYDLTSCGKFRCLYITDFITETVQRVELNGKTIKWHVKETPVGLSVTSAPNYNVIVTCLNARKLIEFTTRGDLVREILLPRDVVNQLHAILFNDQFLVCQGEWSHPSHRVCVVDSTDRVTRSYGEQRGSAKGQLLIPRHLAVDTDGNILVADYGNKRIVTLGPDLTDVRELVDVSGRPSRLCFSGRRLYVTDESFCTVRIFEEV